jgi:hypothetical protein
VGRGDDVDMYTCGSPDGQEYDKLTKNLGITIKVKRHLMIYVRCWKDGSGGGGDGDNNNNNNNNNNNIFVV